MKFTYKQIMALDPCYDPVKYIPKDWEGTALDILNLEGPSISDKLWVVLNKGFIPDNILHEFSCRCAEHVLHLYEAEYPNDHRPRNAIKAKRRWMNKEITENELATARDDAWAAVRTTTKATVRAAAWAATMATTKAATKAAAAWAARATARDDEDQWQFEMLKELLNGDA